MCYTTFAPQESRETIANALNVMKQEATNETLDKIIYLKFSKALMWSALSQFAVFEQSKRNKSNVEIVLFLQGS